MNEIAKYLTKSTMSGNDIAQVIQLIDQESANSIYRSCAEEFNFKIVEVEGNILTTARELSLIFGYSSAKEVLQVLIRSGVETTTVGCLRQNDASKVQAEFSLSTKDHATKLMDYHGFLSVALEGHGSACDKVREYLLAMEQKARIDTVIYENTGFQADDFQDVGEYANDPTIQTMNERTLSKP